MRFVLLLVIMPLLGFSQKNSSIEFTIKNIVVADQKVNIELELVNYSDSLKIIHKPNIDALCMNILRITFEDKVSGEKYLASPCDEILDIDNVDIGFYNGVGLNNNERFSCELSLSLRHISPYLRMGRTYFVVGDLFLENVNFNSKYKCLFLRNLSTGKFNFEY